VPRFEQFRLPDAGEGLTEAEVVTWHVAVGDRVEVNQPLVEIETAKSLVELPSPFDGVVTEILVAPGTTVDVGTPIVTVDTGTSDGAPDTPADADTGARPSAAGAAADGSADGATGGASGDGEGSGAVLVGYGVASHGALRRRRGSGTPSGTGSGTAAPGPAAELAAPTAAPPVATSSSSRVLAKPPVRRLAKDLGVDLATVNPTGPGGIVTREDVVTRAEANKGRELTDYPTDEPWLASGTVSPDGRTTRVPVRSVRKRTAEAMVSSAFTAPHVSVFHTVDVTRTMRLVAQLREDREFADVRVTPLLIAAKALLIAVRRHPEVNASWVDETQEIVYKHYVNLGIAAQTPRGLVVPNIKDAHRLSLHDLAVALAELTATARAGRTTPTDMSDGTITITNVGVFGIDTGTPILNPGESAILAFGAVREQPWVHKGRIRKRHVTQLALSFDHRLVDGGLGSRLLADVAAVLEDPAKGLVWG
jgi:pyruvate dehydrogenase E2 component (dihydrolipoamide acetyltransferase)